MNDMHLVELLAKRPPPKLVLDSIVRMRRRLRSVRSGLVPVNAEIIERTLAIVEVRCLGIAAELDVATHLEKDPHTTEDLAEKLQVDADSLGRMMAFLSSMGFFKRDRRNRWINTRLSSALRDDHPLGMRDWARFFGGPDHLRIWSHADVPIRSGESATKVATGAEFFEWLGVERGVGQLFDGAMLEGSRFLGRSFATTVDLKGVNTICDVGGGTGKLLIEVLQKHPDLRGILFDLHEVVVDAKDKIEQASLSDRIDLVGGSFFEEVPDGAQRYVLVSIVHDWDDEHATTILSRCRAQLGPDDRVLVVEQILPDKGPAFFAHYSDVLMLILGSGRERTDEGFRTLFRGAGLGVTRTWTLATLHRVYELAAV